MRADASRGDVGFPNKETQQIAAALLVSECALRSALGENLHKAQMIQLVADLSKGVGTMWTGPMLLYTTAAINRITHGKTRIVYSFPHLRENRELKRRLKHTCGLATGEHVKRLKYVFHTKGEQPAEGVLTVAHPNQIGRMMPCPLGNGSNIVLIADRGQ